MLTLIGLGSNVGNREAHLAAAREALAKTLADMQVSSIIETPALLPEGAPADWNVPYLNQVVCGDCALAPMDLLARAKALETLQGRMLRGLWGPREIDIDILAHGETVMHTPALTLPHPHLHLRRFVLQPLAEIAPDWVHPLLKTSAAELLKALP